MTDSRLLVSIASYNTNLQGHQGIPQDLVDWLAPTLQVSTFLTKARAPDIIAVGFQELLPLHHGLAGFSRAVIRDRAAHILAQLEKHSPKNERYTLVSKVDNVGVALLVYAKDDGVARQISDVQTAWTGCGPLYMGNKGAVGVRFRVKEEEEDAGETYTFVCAHLTAHPQNLKERICDYHHIVGSLLFPPIPGTKEYSTMYATSNLFFLGDLNFRLDVPETHPMSSVLAYSDLSAALEPQNARTALKEFDQLYVERKKGSSFVAFREGEFWKFKCSYKYELGEVDKYSHKRTPSWTDRILYVSHSDSPQTLEESNITNLLYTSIPSYTTSDHKPIVSLLLLPARTISSQLPLIKLPEGYSPKPDRKASLKRYSGRMLDRIIGLIWSLFSIIGFGSASIGSLVGLMVAAWSWWRSR